MAVRTMTHASEPAEDTPPWKDEWRDWADCFAALLQGDPVAEQAMKWIEAQPGYDRGRPTGYGRGRPTPASPPPHGLPRELKMAGKDENGFIFLNDYAVPITRTFDDHGKLRLKVGPCDPVARQQLDDWLAWGATEAPGRTSEIDT